MVNGELGSGFAKIGGLRSSNSTRKMFAFCCSLIIRPAIAIIEMQNVVVQELL